MLLTALLFNTLTGAVCASVLGFSPAAGAVGMNAVAAFMGMAPQSASILREGVYTEIWTGELVKVLRAGLEGTWLSGIPDQSSIVNNDDTWLFSDDCNACVSPAGGDWFV